MTRALRHILIFLLLGVSFASQADPVRFVESSSELKLIENKGQWEDQILYRADIAIGKIYFEPDGFTFLFHDPLYHQQHSCATHGSSCSVSHGVNAFSYKMEFQNSNPSVSVEGSYSWPHYHNYFICSDEARWADSVLLFKKITYTDLYPGIDMEVYGVGDDLKYDLIVHPGADPAQVELLYIGLDGMIIDKKELKYQTPFADVTEKEPVSFQYGTGGDFEEVKSKTS